LSVLASHGQNWWSRWRSWVFSRPGGRGWGGIQTIPTEHGGQTVAFAADHSVSRVNWLCGVGDPFYLPYT
jgi:hypothetical protein